MKIKIFGKCYTILNDLNCIFFKSLQEENVTEIELTLFTDVFIQLYKKEDIPYYKFDTEKFEYYYKAFTYFGSDKESELIAHAFLHFFYIKNIEHALKRVEWLEKALCDDCDIYDYYKIDNDVIDSMIHSELSTFKQLDSVIKQYINTNKNELLKIVRPKLKPRYDTSIRYYL